MLWRLDESALLLMFVFVLLAATEFGFRQGLRHAPASDDATHDHADSLQAAVLGLLALLLGFTFFMAVSRFDDRKVLVLDEANAMGTVLLRARFLAPDQQERVRVLVKAHLAARLAVPAAGIDAVRIEQVNAEAGAIERDLWSLAVDAAARDPRSVTTGLFAESVNTVIDLREKRRVSLDNHVPETVLHLLLVVSAVAFGAIGYKCGLAGRRRFASNAIFALLIVFVLVLILDIDRPGRGLITVPQDSLLRLQASLEAPTPPGPPR